LKELKDTHAKRGPSKERSLKKTPKKRGGTHRGKRGGTLITKEDQALGRLALVTKPLIARERGVRGEAKEGGKAHVGEDTPKGQGKSRKVTLLGGSGRLTEPRVPFQPRSRRHGGTTKKELSRHTYDMRVGEIPTKRVMESGRKQPCGNPGQVVVTSGIRGKGENGRKLSEGGEGTQKEKERHATGRGSAKQVPIRD